MPIFLHNKMWSVSILLLASLMPALTQASGGVVLGGTRIIYPAGQKETSISAHNTSEDSRFMVQSWVEDSDGNKAKDFIVTPPLYVSNPQSENTLRLMYAGPKLPSDRETLYYLVSKAIPAVDKNAVEGKNLLILSAATRIKLFVRPAGIHPSPDEAPKKLTFSREGHKAIVKNPTPYYITLTAIKADGQPTKESVMVPPSGSEDINLPSARAASLSYQTINDYGGLTEEIIWKF